MGTKGGRGASELFPKPLDGACGERRVLCQQQQPSFALHRLSDCPSAQGLAPSKMVGIMGIKSENKGNRAKETRRFNGEFENIFYLVRQFAANITHYVSLVPVKWGTAGGDGRGEGRRRRKALEEMQCSWSRMEVPLLALLLWRSKPIAVGVQLSI